MISNLEIKGEKDLPCVKFDHTSGWLYMGGSSLPENVIEFYDPLLKWLEEYKMDAHNTTQFEFNFEYLNTASTYMMARIIRYIEEIKDQSKDVTITWYYNTGDIEMKELGIELLEDSGIKYEITPV